LPPGVFVLMASVRLWKPYTLAVEPLDDREQIGQAPAEAIEPPDGEHVASTATIESVAQSRSIRLRACNCVGEYFLASGFGKGIDLQIEALIR